jgi:hypothetical protein
MAWKKGPLPPGTYNWGGVVPVEGYCSGPAKAAAGFYFADFRGDTAVIPAAGPDAPEIILKAYEVAWYDNSLELPPPEAKVYGRSGAQSKS